MPGGSVTTPAQWAKALGFTTRPALVLYDEGREVFRFDGHLVGAGGQTFPPGTALSDGTVSCTFGCLPAACRKSS